VPKWQEDAAKDALARANQVAGIGYVPYYGPDVAALTPMQLSAMQGTNQAASAFGMPTSDLAAGLPTAQNFNGMQAYSSGGLYDQAVKEVQTRNPEQYAKLVSQYDDKAAPTPTPVPTPVPTTKKSRRRKKNPSTMAVKNALASSSGSSSSGGGYSSLRDRFDGGGAGTSGESFSGGTLGSILNIIGINPLGSKKAATTVAPKTVKPATTVAPRTVKPASRGPSGRV
jgi:hypothetical protein